MTGVGHPEAAAWHEAGHALVAHLLGGRIHELTLEDESGELDGRASIDWVALEPARRPAASACTALGGPLAELAFLDEPLEHLAPSTVAAWEADWAVVEAEAAQLEPEPARRYALIHEWLEDVRAALEDPHNAERLARIADALDAHGTLDEFLFAECL